MPAPARNAVGSRGTAVLSSFEITGFRTFRHLRVPRLGRVNLIVGRNNVGKTMFLEALRLYACEGHPRAIRHLLLERDEVHADGEQSDDEPGSTPLRFSALFHRTPRPVGRITLGELDCPNRLLTLAPRLIRRVRQEGSFPMYGYEAVHGASLGAEPGLLPGLEIGIEGNSRLMPFSLISGRGGSAYRTDDWYEPAFVPARGLGNRELARWWDAVALEKAEPRVIEGLRLLLDTVDRVTFVEHPHRRGERLPIVTTSADATPTPLRSLGDGVGRVFQIALAAERARAGRQYQLDAATNLFADFGEDRRLQTPLLLIDEIENGIHNTVHAKLWTAVLKLAELHDIQVFATTHSWDCICGLRDAVAAVPAADAVLVRLEKANGANKAVVFEKDELDIITRDEIEVR